jgi:hypothetical protein
MKGYSIPLPCEKPPIKIVNHSFSELAEKYLLWAARQRSYRSKQVIVKQMVGEFGNIPLRRFSTMLVEQYQSKILAGGKKPATAIDSCIINVLCEAQKKGTVFEKRT